MINAPLKCILDDFAIQISQYLCNNFEEFKDLSSLKISNIVSLKSGEILPMDRKIGDYLEDGDEIICNLESLDIWVNVHLNLRSTDKTFRAYAKMRVENQLTITEVENMCQKLGLLIWNKFWIDKPSKQACLSKIENASKLLLLIMLYLMDALQPLRECFLNSTQEIIWIGSKVQPAVKMSRAAFLKMSKWCDNYWISFKKMNEVQLTTNMDGSLGQV